ncbi:hypothetical protein [Agromyces kandeliae]|uniref:Uncharacterized protein n=1 Tax=Agromyces kandeliae TaxID=2666141 RepID=A0A6L5R4K6_9MICO|nr:hypothetical protein [Agromyces kandeliae]MRX44514.1 hypothetical protein [Agromyces kandeliae]
MTFDRMAEAMGLAQADMHTYGAEDMEELISILGALDRANGDMEPWLVRGSRWESVIALPRKRLGGLSSSEIPMSPGVLVFFDADVPVFVGEGTGRNGLRGRLRQHRATGSNLSSSTLRASVAVEVLGVSRWTARQRPGVLLDSMVEEVNEVVAEFEVAWIECETPEAAHELKHQLWMQYKPEHNIL